MSTDQRSEKSLTFERQWSELRKEGELILSRSAFDPLDFLDFLPVLVIAEIDLASRTMPIRFAGSAIRDFVGFELTGKDFIEYDSNANAEVGWQHRQAYHDHPCGRYEVLDIKFQGGFHMECALTILPLTGTNEERLVVTLVEPIESKVSIINSETELIAEALKYGTYLDTGSGTPTQT